MAYFLYHRATNIIQCCAVQIRIAIISLINVPKTLLLSFLAYYFFVQLEKRSSRIKRKIQKYNFLKNQKIQSPIFHTLNSKIVQWPKQRLNNLFCFMIITLRTKLPLKTQNYIFDCLIERGKKWQ